MNARTPLGKETTLHLVAVYSSDTPNPDTLRGMANTARLLLANGADPNAQDNNGRYVPCKIGRVRFE